MHGLAAGLRMTQGGRRHAQAPVFLERPCQQRDVWCGVERLPFANGAPRPLGRPLGQAQR